MKVDHGHSKYASPGKGEVGAQRRVGVSRFDRTVAKTARARKLRNAQTPAEAKLWSRLRNDAMHGVSFRRQHPVGEYVLDFYSPTAKLAVEVDGGQHNDDDHRRRDEMRDIWLAAKGIRTLRFWNTDVMANIDSVLATIWHAVDVTTPTLPLLGGGSADYGTMTLTSPGKGEVGAQRRVGITRLYREPNA
jgi:very-short-patch-repair endonuclease